VKRTIEISDDSNYVQYLVKEKELADQIINNSRSMISIINRNYIYEKVNATFCNAQNVIMDSVVGKSLSDVWGKETFRKIIRSNVDQCFAGKTVRYEASFETPALGKRHFEVTFRPLVTGDGKISHLLAETFDISEMQLLKQAAIEKAEELARFETMLPLLENRLLQAQKLETVGALAGGIAHDFNNLLAIISGYAEMIQEDLPKGSDLFEKVCKIQGAVHKAQSLTKQILTFSRHVEQERVKVSISDVLKETLGLVRSSVSPDIIVKSAFPKKTVNVFADPTQLFRVFLNLMTNAVQSMEEDGGVLTVTLETVSGKSLAGTLTRDILADEYALLTFTDTGTGMDPSLMRRIFEPFFTTREVGKGTGLGLSVVHGIVMELEGEIIVSANKNKGSVFSVYLPVTDEYPSVQRVEGERKKILFIRGNRYESKIFSIALESTGHELIFASDKRQLIKLMKNAESEPDLIVIMNDSKQIKAEDLLSIYSNNNRKTPCILISDLDQGNFEEKLLNSGIVSHHLMKPLSLKEIRNAIDMSLL